MSDDVDPRPIPWGLVEHVHRSKSGKTTLQISLSIETRALLAQAALDLGCSKLALVQGAVSQFLVHHEESQRAGQERALAAVSEVAPPVTDPTPVETGGSTVAEPEHLPVMEPEPEGVIEPRTSAGTPEQAPAPKRSPRARPGGRKGPDHV